ncbi:Cu2+-exporting ATPase [Anaerosphaera aminiphila DSM 21120]|uniref:P-type Cu(+) transporter n=2 Tax=Anaerosphaera TaxID=1273095 RepID=A0A1M5UAB4_9FIRM|nr:Cu2+-exporting ATPase [Anaerosphaera aminiphila DSM 21120]
MKNIKGNQNHNHSKHHEENLDETKYFKDQDNKEQVKGENIQMHSEHSSSDEHMHMDHSNMSDMSHDNMDHTNHGDMDHSSMGHMGHMGNLKQKFFVSLVISIPILILSPMMGIKLPFQFTFPGSQWIVLILSTILFFYGGMPFLSGARQELKDKSPAMMTLISLGITTSYLYSLYAFISNTFINPNGHVMDFFWELATLIVIMLLGHWIEMRAVAGAGDALQSLAKLLPSEASVQQPDGSFKQTPLSSLATDQVIMVKAGEKVPADGIILEGSTDINESMLTGEASKVSKNKGDTVIGGSQNGSGSVLVKVTGTGDSGYLAQVMQLVSDAQQAKSRAETMSDKVARWLFYIATATGIITLVVWFAVTKKLDVAVTRMVTVLVIACPHALGLAIPLVTARSTSLGAQNGLLVRKRQALETAPKVNVVMMDKTGTLTEGNFKVTEVISLNNNYSEESILSMMASLEVGSSHPLAVGIVSEATSRKLEILSANEIQSLPGVGIEGKLNNKDARIVTANYLNKNNISHDFKEYDDLSKKGYSISFLLLEGSVVGVVAQGDEIKPQAKSFISQLKSWNITPIMLTGDNSAAAEKTANFLGIDVFKSSLLPEDKEKVVEEYQNSGKVVMMVGDGVNDAPSLAQADIGVAIGAGTDVAIDSADVVLVKSDPSDIIHFLSLGRDTTRKMVQNLWWGAGYNIVAIPLAAGVLSPIGITLSPAVGAILMSLSTVIVAINALTLKIRDLT